MKYTFIFNFQMYISLAHDKHQKYMMKSFIKSRDFDQQQNSSIWKFNDRSA